MECRTMMHGLRHGFMVALALMAASCGDSQSAAPAAGCAAGSMVACSWTDGSEGAQTCRADGTFDPCLCEGLADAGELDALSDSIEETGEAGSAESGEDAAPLSCPYDMLLTPEGFCIDRLEVTRGEYQPWADTWPSTAGQPEGCVFNEPPGSFLPDPTCMAGATCQSTCAEHPQGCVDWCDAAAYCKGAAKRLCKEAEMHAVCTSGGENVRVYGGDSTLPGTCAFDGVTVAVGSYPGCQPPNAPYKGVLDLMGNIGEWTDDCYEEISGEMRCPLYGGSYNHGSDCGRYNDAPRAYAVPYFGFRCCADPS